MRKIKQRKRRRRTNEQMKKERKKKLKHKNERKIEQEIAFIGSCTSSSYILLCAWMYYATILYSVHLTSVKLSVIFPLNALRFIDTRIRMRRLSENVIDWLSRLGYTDQNQCENTYIFSCVSRNNIENLCNDHSSYRIDIRTACVSMSVCVCMFV